MGVFAAHQHPHPRRPTGLLQVVQQSGEVGDLRAVRGSPSASTAAVKASSGSIAIASRTFSAIVNPTE